MDSKKHALSSSALPTCTRTFGHECLSEKHKHKEPRLYCKTCELLVDCRQFDNHHNHDIDLLEAVADEQRYLLLDEARRLDVAMLPLQEAIKTIAEEDRILGENRRLAQASVREHFEKLVQRLRARGEDVMEEVEGVWEEKHKILEEQRKGLEVAVAEMSIRVKQVQREVRLSEPLEDLETSSRIVKELKGLRERSFDLAPQATRKLEFECEAAKSNDDMMQRIDEHGM
eukprot:2918582-Rhodomonas_salina.1